MEKATHTKDAQTEKKQPKSTNCKGPHVGNYEGCPSYKKTGILSTCSGEPKKLCLHLKQNSALPPQPKGDALSFMADQLVKFVSEVLAKLSTAA